MIHLTISVYGNILGRIAIRCKKELATYFVVTYDESEALAVAFH